jgi:hypothetical protein
MACGIQVRQHVTIAATGAAFHSDGRGIQVRNTHRHHQPQLYARCNGL